MVDKPGVHIYIPYNCPLNIKTQFTIIYAIISSARDCHHQMVLMALPFALKLVHFFFRFVQKLTRNYSKPLPRSFSNSHASHFKHQKPFSAVQRSELSGNMMIFEVESTLLRSSSLFPYFMLVAFEAGSLVRAFILLALYPIISLFRDEMSLNVMVFVSFCGIRKERFRVGRAVLPKFFLEDVGLEGFEVLQRGGRKVGVSCLPLVMVESFLKDYMEIDFAVGRELRVWNGFFVGLMEPKETINHQLKELLDDKMVCSTLVGFGSSNNLLNHQWFSHCKEIFMVNDVDKNKWKKLPTNRYPKPLIFHDGRFAFRPDPFNMLAFFMWLPYGLPLSVLRIVIAITLPYGFVIPFYYFTGFRAVFRFPPSPLTQPQKHHKGHLYVCNHRTLIDPLILSFGIKKPVAAVTYSLSRMSEILSPIKTFRLKRDRDQDGQMMDKLLRQGDLVVCPEGTTCREPYLLRYSPLFAELSEDIVPVAMDCQVTMFYGTTAGGLKCLDPIFFLMNPNPVYTAYIIGKISGTNRSGTDSNARCTTTSSFELANWVQHEVAKVLGFECTSLTRKDKYMILAGNEGIICKS